MKFAPDVHDTEVPALLEAVIDITGFEPWAKRFAWLAHEVRENPYMRGWLEERCGLEWTLNELLSGGEVRINQPFPLRSAKHYELAAFLAGVSRTYERLTAVGRKRLRGMLLDGLKSDKGLLSVQHEITTAVHLMVRGFDVEFSDMETGGAVDFIARKGSVEIEVECKMFSADVGRKIHRRRSATLFGTLRSIVEQTYAAAIRGLVIRISIPDHLTPSRDQHQRIRASFARALVAGGRLNNGYCAIDTWDFDVEHSPFGVAKVDMVDSSRVKDFVAAISGNPNPNLMTVFSPGKRAVVVVVESVKPDDVIGGMRRQLRDSAVGQFSRTRPAYLAVQLHDLTDDQLVNVADADSSMWATATPLQKMTSELLGSPSRAHLHTVAYRAHGVFRSDGTFAQARGAAYAVFNHLHAMAKDENYAIFRDPSRSTSRIVLI